jgi:uncharacterized protein YjiS (DUF1127 family)
METAMSTTSVLRPVRSFPPRLTLRGLLRTLVNADARHRAAVHFSRLDDHLLRDISEALMDHVKNIRFPY